jgi:hypothetical protein
MAGRRWKKKALTPLGGIKGCKKQLLTNNLMPMIK